MEELTYYYHTIETSINHNFWAVSLCLKMIKHIKRYLSEYFGMSRSEARGFLSVIFFTIICISVPYIIKNEYSEKLIPANEK